MRLSRGQKFGAIGLGAAAGAVLGGAVGAPLATGKKNPKDDGFTRKDLSNTLWWTLALGATGGAASLINEPRTGLFIAAGGVAAGLVGAGAYGMLY